MQFDWRLIGQIVIVAGFLAFPAAIVLSIRHAKREQKRMREQNLAWYRAEHPTRVTKDAVSCRECGSTNVGTERVLERTYMRRHLCRNCGTTLYYSPET